MANQAIALQARAPQTDILGSSMARNAQMINMMMQQRAAERRAAQAQQQMQLAQTKEAREARTSDLEYQVNAAKFFRQMGKAVGDDATYQAWLSRVEKISPEDAAAYRAFSPNYDPDKMDQIIMDVEQYINKKIATPVASFQVSDKGVPQSVTSGGTAPSIKEIPQFRYEADQPPATGAVPQPPRMTPAPPVAPEVLDAAAAAIAAGKDVSDPALRNLSADAFKEAQRRALNLRLDTMPPAEGGVQPMSTQQGQADLPRIVQTMMQTGFIPQSDFEAMRQTAGPEKEAQLAQIMRDNGIQIVPDAAPQGGARDAVYRPEEGLAVLQRGAPEGAMQEAGYVPTTTRFKSPMQAPMPGSAIVPPKRIKEEKVAETSGAEETKFDVELRKSLPKAKGALNLAVKGLDRDLSDIDYVLTNPAREMIVGSIEGRLHPIVNVFRGEAGQQAQNVQSRLDKIKASSVVKHLQEMRDASPQGSSLFGQVTEYEDRLVAALAGLDQAQDERTFDNALRQYRSVIVEMRQNLPAVFNDTYGKVGAKETVSAPTPAPGEAPRKTDVDYLMKNRNNPRVVGAFRQHFGEQNLQRALRGR